MARASPCSFTGKNMIVRAVVERGLVSNVPGGSAAAVCSLARSCGEKGGGRGLPSANAAGEVSIMPCPSPEIRVALEFRPFPVKNGGEAGKILRPPPDHPWGPFGELPALGF